MCGIFNSSSRTESAETVQRNKRVDDHVKLAICHLVLGIFFALACISCIGTLEASALTLGICLPLTIAFLLKAILETRLGYKVKAEDPIRTPSLPREEPQQ